MSQRDEDTLDHYLRGEHGELMRQAALEELQRRDQGNVSIEDMIAHLKGLGYELLSPMDLTSAQAEERCPWCGASYQQEDGIG